MYAALVFYFLLSILCSVDDLPSLPPNKDKPAPISQEQRQRVVTALSGCYQKFANIYIMPPKLDNNLLSMFQQMLEMQMEFMNKFDGILERMLKYEEKQDVILERLLHIEGAIGKRRISSTAPPANLELAVSSAIEEIEMKKDKSLRAVVERLPELESDEITEANDKQKILKMGEKMNLTEQLIPSLVHRHGRKNDKFPRVIKVSFKTGEARNQFIRQFNRYRDECFGASQMKPTCRRDMTPNELEKQRKLRKECYDRNLKAGVFQYFYRDLHIYECSKPFKQLNFQPPH